jgi:hypothetical protein
LKYSEVKIALSDIAKENNKAFNAIIKINILVWGCNGY